MARITVEDCLKKVDNQYDLVLLAKERTSQLNSGSEMLVKEDNDKNTVVALREIAEDKVGTDDLRKNAILRLRKNPMKLPAKKSKKKSQMMILKANIKAKYLKVV